MKISEIIVGWYKKNRRDLPWRATSDPYRIWLSEIILQQTRVDQGLGYYHRFVEQFPDVHTLAAADERQVMKLWQGLGYYSRARNLLKAARQVVEDHGGIFPRTLQGLRSLRGVGEYTSAAVASIAFNVPAAVVDGNVARVIARLYAVDEPVNTTAGAKVIAALAEQLLDPDDPGTHNQAMMEFGALQCVPSNPDCAGCMLKAHCTAYERGLTAAYPVKRRSGKIKKRFFTYLVIDHGGQTYLQQRTANDIWRHLYEFPLMEHESMPEPEQLGGLTAAFLGLDIGEFTITRLPEPVKHQLTHRRIIARFIHLQITPSAWRAPEHWKRVDFGEITDYPVPRIIDLNV